MSARPQRIVFILQTESVSDASWDPVLRIARRSAARIEGVFVEDRRLFDIAGFPSARFVHAHSQQTSAMDEGGMRRVLRVTSARVRQAFTARVSATAIPWAFSSRLCAHLSEAFAEATRGDLVIVPLLLKDGNIGQISDLIRAVTHRSDASLLILNERSAPVSSILVLFDGDRHDLTAALDLAEALECRAMILAVADEAGASAALADMARDHLTRLQRSAPIDTLVYHAAADLDQAIRAVAPSLLVVDRDSRTAQTLDLAALLTAAPFSLYLRN